MNDQEVRETLEKQLQILSERSKEESDNRTLVAISSSMCIIARIISQEYGQL